ncbi:MAG: T9SS type A sorting domain-containing protein, partial [Bacteroidia bacterium]|nr:T9SS type A sorting domain-containing protein [Bacteroidia bacterium]
FEMGDFTGWHAQIGNCCPIVTTPSGFINNRHTITSGTGLDPNTGGVVPVVCPDGGIHSARLGNDSIGHQAEKLIFTIPNVDSSNALFVYKYAVILQDPGHLAGQQPRFDIAILNSSNQIIDSVCGYYSVYASPGLAGFEVYYPPDDTVPVVFRNWTWVGMNLEPYMGQFIAIEFATGDCSLGGHYGYAYIDAYCAPMNINALVCGNTSSITFTAPPGFLYNWSNGATTQTVEIDNPQNGQTFNCVLSTISNPQCQLTLSTVVTGVVVNGGTEMTVCEHDNLNLDIGGQHDGATYTWTGPNNFTSTIYNPVINNVSLQDSGIYHFTVYVTPECITEANVVVTVVPLPVVDLGPDTMLCTNATLFYDLSYNQGCNFHWHAQTGSTSSNSTLPTMLIDKPGIYSVSVTNGTCPPVIDTIVVNYNNIGLDLGTDISGVCQTNTVTLDATTPLGGYPSVSYHWSDGEITPTLHAWTSGNYFVTVDRGQCSESDTIHVQYDSPIIINFPQSYDLCPGSSFTINPGTFPNSVYHWSTGNNTQSLVVTNPGDYSLTVTNACGAYKDTAHVVSAYPPTVDLGNDTTVCLGQIVYLSALNNQDVSYLWSNNQVNPAIAVTTGGLYTVTVTNYCGIAIGSVVVTMDTPLNINLGNDSTVCPGYLLDCGYSGAVYVWSDGQTTQSVHAYSPGYYSVEVTNTCGTYTGGVNLNIMETTVNLGNDTIICPGTSLLLNAGPGIYYSWSTGQNIPEIEVNESGFYDVAVTNTCGTYFDTIQVTVFDPVLNIGNDTTICSGTSLTIDAHHPGSEYQWSTGANTQSIEVIQAGTYFVNVIHPCANLSDTITISVNPSPSIDLGPDTVHPAGQSVILDAGSGYETYHWSTGASTQTITVQNMGYYYVTVTDENGCHGTDHVFVQFTGIPENLSGSVSVIPDASGNNVIVTSTNKLINKVEIFDCLGNLICSDHSSAKRYLIGLNKVSSGLYIIRLEIEGKAIIKKLNLVK